MKQAKEEAPQQYPLKIKADIASYTALNKGLTALNKPLTGK